MTKEEAKNRLVNTKVYVAGKSAEIQKKLFELGFEWDDVFDEDPYATLHTGAPFIFIEHTLTCSSGMYEFVEKHCEEITAEYILNLTWEEEKPKFQPFDKVLVRDNDNQNWRPRFYYECCNNENSGCVWCQIIPYESNEHLAYTTNNPE